MGTQSLVVAVQASLSRSYPALPESIPRVRHEVEAVAAANGAGVLKLEEIALATSEAATNVVRHAYRGAGGSLHVSASVIDEELWVLVDDDGCGLRAPSPGPGLGLGMALMASACESFDIFERGGGGTGVRMRFLL